MFHVFVVYSFIVTQTQSNSFLNTLYLKVVSEKIVNVMSSMLKIVLFNVTFTFKYTIVTIDISQVYLLFSLNNHLRVNKIQDVSIISLPK